MIHSGTRSWHRNVDVALHDALLDPLLWNGSEGPPGNKREFRLRTTVLADVVNCRTTHKAAPLIAADPETTVARTLSVEDNLLLALGPELGGTQLLVRCASTCSPRAVSPLGHRRSCQCTEAVGHPLFSVPSKSQTPLVASTTARSAVFCSRSSLVAAKFFYSSKGIAAIFSC